MTRCRNVRRRLIGNGRKTPMVRLLKIGPMRPQARDVHRLCRLGFELQNHVLFPLPCFEFPMLHRVQLHILKKALHHHDGVVRSELFTPEFL